ncbi:hypothetical protein PPYR_14535 [Photinus pyralis]|uniref:Peptidase S1 domain-containing protein n=1 Tax=Photinus pyralis TaxID=7054 RepID=A0A5N4A5G2_PHOPY|nr:hypothetical protein PPYR_14535 [Photinus pyralis]
MFLSLVVILQALGVLNAEVLRSGIVNGTKAGTRPFPHQISLRHQGAHVCGGSIVSPMAALTAIHCFGDKNPRNYVVVVGIKTLKERGVVHNVAKIILSNEITDVFKFDLAIVKVVKPFVFNKLEAPIALDREGTAEATCITSGWGFTRANGQLSQDLLFLEVNTITNRECQLRQPRRSQIIYNSHICTSTPQGKGVCQGDSGGPLVCNDTLAGITSFGWPCALGFPDTFVRVSTFIQYIDFYLDQD